MRYHMFVPTFCDWKVRWRMDPNVKKFVIQEQRIDAGTNKMLLVYCSRPINSFQVGPFRHPPRRTYIHEVKQFVSSVVRHHFPPNFRKLLKGQLATGKGSPGELEPTC